MSIQASPRDLFRAWSIPRPGLERDDVGGAAPQVPHPVQPGREPADQLFVELDLVLLRFPLALRPLPRVGDLGLELLPASLLLAPAARVDRFAVPGRQPAEQGALVRFHLVEQRLVVGDLAVSVEPLDPLGHRAPVARLEALLLGPGRALEGPLDDLAQLGVHGIRRGGLAAGDAEDRDCCEQRDREKPGERLGAVLHGRPCGVTGDHLSHARPALSRSGGPRRD